MGLFRAKTNKVQINLTIDKKNADMVEEVKKEFDLKTTSNTINDILTQFYEDYWETPEKKKKLEEDNEE